MWVRGLFFLLVMMSSGGLAADPYSCRDWLNYLDKVDTFQALPDSDPNVDSMRAEMHQIEHDLMRGAQGTSLALRQQGLENLLNELEIILSKDFYYSDNQRIINLVTNRIGAQRRLMADLKLQAQLTHWGLPSYNAQLLALELWKEDPAELQAIATALSLDPGDGLDRAKQMFAFPHHDLKTRADIGLMMTITAIAESHFDTDPQTFLAQLGKTQLMSSRTPDLQFGDLLLRHLSKNDPLMGITDSHTLEVFVSVHQFDQ